MSRSTLSEPDWSGMCSWGHHVRRPAIALDHVVGEPAGCGEVNRTRRARRPTARPQQLLRTPGGPRTRRRRELTFWPSSVISETPSAISASTSARISPGRRSFSLPRRLGTMQKVQVLLQPTDTDTHAAYADSRRVGSVEGKTSSDLRIRPAPAPAPGALQMPAASRCCGCRRRRRPRAPLGDRRAVLLAPGSRRRRSACRARGLHRREVAEAAVELVVGVLPHGAGVEDDHVRLLARGRSGVTRVLQQPGEALGVVDVHLAPVGADLVRAPGGSSSRDSRQGYGGTPVVGKTERGAAAGWSRNAAGPPARVGPVLNRPLSLVLVQLSSAPELPAHLPRGVVAVLLRPERPPGGRGGFGRIWRRAGWRGRVAVGDVDAGDRCRRRCTTGRPSRRRSRTRRGPRRATLTAFGAFFCLAFVVLRGQVVEVFESRALRAGAGVSSVLDHEQVVLVRNDVVETRGPRRPPPRW